MSDLKPGFCDDRTGMLSSTSPEIKLNIEIGGVLLKIFFIHMV